MDKKYEYIDAAKRGLSMAQAAELFGVSRQAVWEFSKRHGIEFRNEKVRRDWEEILGLYESGMTFREIADARGVSYNNIQKLFASRGLKANKRPVKFKGMYPDPTDKRKFHPEEIKHVFGYCPRTGVVRDKSKNGMPVGSVDPAGYLSVWFRGANLKVHRIAWVVQTGGWPDNVIDHINGVKTDNRFANLRDVTQSENAKAVHRNKRS